MRKSENKPLGCGICPYKTNSACHLERHLRIHTGHKPFACEMCSYRATDGGLLKRHMRIHSGEKPFICHICGHKTAQSCSLKDHMAVHTGKKRYSCDLCPFQCSRIGRLRDHQRIHSIKTESMQDDVPKDEARDPSANDSSEPKNDADHVLQKCAHCSFEFSETQYLERHMSSVHSAEIAKPVVNPPENEAVDSPYFCSFCATPRESSEDLNNHMALHIVYKCLKCKLIFETPDELTAHGFNHTNELIFNCNFCDFKCRTRNELRGHGRIHSTQLFKCSSCDFESRSAIEFSQHLMTHTVKEMVVCNICSHKFRKTEELRAHMVSHYTRVRTRTVRQVDDVKSDNYKQVVGDSYSCFYCSFKCPEEREVEKHIADAHFTANLSTKHATSNNLNNESCRDGIRANSSNIRCIDVTELEGYRGTMAPLLSTSSGYLTSHHRQINSIPAGFIKTVRQQIYHRAYYGFIDSNYYQGHKQNIQFPSSWNNVYAGHYLGDQSLAYSMQHYRDVELCTGSSGSCKPSLSIMQPNQRYDTMTLGDYLTNANHNFNKQTNLIGDDYDEKVANENGSSHELDILKSRGVNLTQNENDPITGFHRRLNTAMETDCKVFPVENKYSQDKKYKAESQLSTEGTIQSEQIVTSKKSRNVPAENEDRQSISKTNSVENYQRTSKRRKILSENQLSSETETAISNNCQRTEDHEVPHPIQKTVLRAATRVTGKRIIDSLAKHDVKSDKPVAEMVVTTNKARGMKRKKTELRKKTLSKNIAETAQPVSKTIGEKETCGDILLSKLRKFFNESISNSNKDHSEDDSSPNAADGTRGSSAIITIDLSSDNELSDSN